MMSAGLISVVAALTLPCVAAVLWLRLLFPQPAPGRWPLLIGYGYVLGLLGTTLQLRLQAALGSSMDPVLGLTFWPPILTAGILTMAALGLYRLGWTVTTMRSCHAHASRRPMPLQRLLVALLLLLVCIRLLNLSLEVWWLPLYPWDAWTTWAVRAQIWAHAQDLVPFVGPDTWLDDPTGETHSIRAWRYPPTVSLIAAWPTLAFGSWNETAVNLPWIGCALALALGFYGQTRLWGATALTSLVFTWLLLSLPMLNTHIALAGYADLWLATALGLSFFALMHWVRDGDWRQALLALLLALACALIKREGMIWMLLFLPTVLAARLSRNWLLLVLTAVGTGGLLVWIAGGIDVEVPMLGNVIIGPDRLELSWVGVFSLQLGGSWEPVIEHLFIRNNWHLLPFLIPVSWLVAAVLIVRGLGDQVLRAGLMWTTLSLLAIYVLFFWTDASQWADSGASINRILLHFAPALLFWILTVWSALISDRPTCS
ncbi:hypothetical protein F2Q65_01130 [Thiohalocapsa marina]|uniref:Glycosyltransferase RgtA/B/C/D-like domain-containing protein n=1 Tax=Thiohalocapsa marina TaxID=424902 RepID=A0A5M8FVM9_9GAMM|nr:hypothetical protein [Thiohalocapsa marina]KAA6187870.1 hypothetical protein F2Q65_01130 [Thiohalocapsa marina]